MKRKIFHLITSLNVGGTEQFLIEVVRGLKDRFDMEVGYLKDFGRKGEELQRLGVSPRHFQGFFSLVRFLKTYQPDVLHTHLYRARILGCPAGRLASVPLIIAGRRAFDDWRNPPLIWLDRCVAPLAHRVVTNAPATRTHLIREGVAASRIIVLPPALSTDFQPPTLDKKQIRAAWGWNDGSEPIIGSLLRLHKEKGADFLPDIVQGIADVFPKASFYFGGEGKLKASIIAKLQRRSLHARCHWLGWVQDRAGFLSALDLFILPSREESFSQALLEAAAVGIPFAAMDVGGVSDLLAMGGVGQIARRGDISGLVQASIGLLKSLPENRQRAQGVAAAIRGKVTLDRMLEALIPLYEDIRR
jgi:glycosyltransferase involved in cell wall biosynthesis